MSTPKQKSNTKYTHSDHRFCICEPPSRLAMAGFSKEEQLVFEGYYAKAMVAGDDDRLVQLVDLMLKMLLKAGRAKEKWCTPNRWECILRIVAAR